MRIAILPAALLLMFVTGCMTTVKPGYDTLIAHRGESYDAPENTLPAYRTAIAAEAFSRGVQTVTTNRAKYILDTLNSVSVK